MRDVTAAILIDDGKVLIARRRSGDRLAGKWEFPGGKVRDGETPEQCLEREMQEEFGICVAIGPFFGESIYRYSHGSIRLLAFTACWESGNIQSTAHAEYRWVPVDRLDRYDFSPADIPFVERLMECRRVLDASNP